VWRLVIRAGLSALYAWQDYLATQVPFVWQPGPYSMTEVSGNPRGVLPQSTTGNLNPEDWYFVK
jgi:peptide/nickel transport system substrate-binding protein